MKPVLSIIYVYYNTPEEILNSISSLKTAIKKYSFEIIVIDNNSPKELPGSIFKNKLVQIVTNKENLGFGKAVNQGAKKSNGQYLLVINPDTICSENSIDYMIEGIKGDKKIGILGPQLKDGNGKILHSIGSMPRLPDGLFVFSFLDKLFPNNKYSKLYWAREVNRNTQMETETIGGACMLFRNTVFKKVRGFDERFFMYFEEADICYRVTKLGYKIVYFPQSIIVHFVGKSTSDKKWIQKTFEESRYKFFQKYYGTPRAFLAEFFLRISAKISSLI